MSHYFTLGTPVIVACLGLVGIWLKHRLDRQDRQVADVAQAAADAAVAAALAASRSLPTSNGFAEGVRADLKFIKGELGGIRSDHRHLTRRFDDHLKEATP